MTPRSSPCTTSRILAPTAPRRKSSVLRSDDLTDHVTSSFENDLHDQRESHGSYPASLDGIWLHPLTSRIDNQLLRGYELDIKGHFDRIVPVLKQLSALQKEPDFITKAQALAKAELGFTMPLTILEKAWVKGLDMRSLFAWCVFEAYEQISDDFFRCDPLIGAEGGIRSELFESFLLECGFHLLDITPCADGRLAHAIAYVLRLPFSSVRRRSHAGALFDIENTVSRWVKTEHLRYREAKPNPALASTRYLKIAVYHFSSYDPHHKGCAAHGSSAASAASAALMRLRDFRESIEKSFCCGASVDFLLIGIDTDTDSIRIHIPAENSTVDLAAWLDVRDIYCATLKLNAEAARKVIVSMILKAARSGSPDEGMLKFICQLVENNLSQIDYVRQFHKSKYADADHAERFIGVGIGFKEIHLRNLTYFAHLDTVEEGAPDLDVGIKIFKGLNVSRDLPIPVVVRFDYHSNVPGARERAIQDCNRVQRAIQDRYAELYNSGMLHILLTVRDRDQYSPSEAIKSTIDLVVGGSH
uniref:Carboxysome shell carbonic anhydrase n=1 Tax=Paulinella chromatophora TaxID=39717 RepID=A6YIN2_PAUCH|nr:Carboxysome shell polypeptide [Paulinella chromatophora]ABS00404.1 carboxysome shell polypeptide [Paulinella chromatophora]ACB43320.1 Carboxysome shell polypeptide [Paulinella chromatophora]